MSERYEPGMNSHNALKISPYGDQVFDAKAMGSAHNGCGYSWFGQVWAYCDEFHGWCAERDVKLHPRSDIKGCSGLFDIEYPNDDVKFEFKVRFL